CIAGWFLQLSGEYEENAVFFHQNFGIALAIITGILFYLKVKNNHNKIHFPVAIGIGVLLGLTGHLGGNLTHGEDFLTQPLMALLGEEDALKKREPITDINEAVVFHDLVDPVLEKHCYKCHSNVKQKGKLRLDEPGFILKGGKNGEVITAGNPEHSELYQRLILPENDDKKMPPKGKTKLTKDEIEVIKWWIEEAQANFHLKVAEVSPDEGTINMLLALTSGSITDLENPGASSTMVIPDVEVKQPEPKEIDFLKEMGMVITYLTPEKTFVSVNMINNASFSDVQAVELSRIADQIVWLDVSGTQITDKALAEIGKLKNLTRLRLDKTNISDAGLLALKNSEKLVYLNLYETDITDQGLKYLKGLKQLKALYLWQTKVTPGGIENLKKELGEPVEINNGINL
ncbi:MAG: ribonuclease inhibitor, partial [Bacteroidota bacterium]|nr:ribonuclease inhibitor [Bacteroidota bacterium]